MLERQQQMSLSQYTQFYDLLILKDHRLRQMNELVGFNLVYEERKENDCIDFGRKATLR